MKPTFCTLAAPTTGEFKDKGSKFLAFGYRIRTEAELKTQVEILKKEHHKAVHWCWAYRISETEFRANDDGEPAGSAGKPILNTLISQNLEEVGVVVVRYFGGKLLGVPGLIHAYKSATLEAILAAKQSEEIIELDRKATLEITFGFETMNTVMKAIKQFEIEILSQDYIENHYVYCLNIKLAFESQVKSQLAEFLSED